MVILSQLLEGPVGAVGNVGTETFGAFIDNRWIKHHAHGDGTKDGADHNHNGKGDHALWETLGRILYLIYIRRNFLASAYGKYQDRKGGKVSHVELGNQLVPCKVHRNITAVWIDDGGCEHHQDIQDGHDEHTGSRDGRKLL